MLRTLLFHRRRILINICHAGLIAASLAGATFIRFDFTLPAGLGNVLLTALLIAVPAKTLVFSIAGLDRGWWRYGESVELARVAAATLAGSALFGGGLALAGERLPRSVYVLDLLFCGVAMLGARIAVRLYTEVVSLELHRTEGKPVLVYGAGAAGIALLREIRGNGRLQYRVLGFLDDDPGKRNARMLNVPVVGTGREAPRIVACLATHGQRIEEIIIAMPSASPRQLQEAASNCRAAGVSCKILPGFQALLTGRVAATNIRDISTDDLLGREPVHLNESRLSEALAGKSILITGGAGSIGSELARQIAHFVPRTLVVFDQAESDLFRTEIQLRRQSPSVHIVPMVGDICDKARVTEAVRRYGIDAVFHAAAYKHVPMMESNVVEALRNNVLGTWNVVQVAEAECVSSFLMISSDKAVNPTSIMGATKRAAECIVSAPPSGAGKTNFVSVRFGNVLGSNGSVVPLFQSQISAGGPVTVTHPDVRRYFMTIREAVQLILQASTMGSGGEIFVLEMGAPVRIIDLAQKMIRLSGLKPDEDVEIRIVGLRPGEKLNEELTTEYERTLPTPHEKIQVLEGPRVDRRIVESWIARLRVLIDNRDESAVIEHLKELVPEYQSETIRRKPVTMAKAAAVGAVIAQ